MSSSCIDEKPTLHHKSAWVSFVKLLATFKGDLSSLTAPPFLLSPQSVTEFSAYWCENPSLFVAPAHEPDPEKRIVAVLKWFLGTLAHQHSGKDEHGRRKKMKPLNPFLGELFLGKWEDAVGKTNLVAEQVSHHPPITAYNIWNDEHGVRLQGHVAPKTYFSGTVHIDRKGYSLLHIDKYEEDYFITMPKVHVDGLITGSLFLELSGSSYIRSSSGYSVKIDYSSKGWLGGKRNSFLATVFRDADDARGQPATPLYVAEGQWNDAVVLKEAESHCEMEKLCLPAVPRTLLDTAPLEKQHPLESRRAWRHVAAAIRAGDTCAISHEKSRIENEQREMRRREKCAGTEYPRRYFSCARQDPVADRLAAELREGFSLSWESDEPRAVWLWDEEKFRRVCQAE